MSHVQHDELKLLEAQFTGAKIIEHVKDGQFIAPNCLHDELEQQINALATLCEPVQFEIHEDAFCIMAHKHTQDLVEIARQSKCLLEIESPTTITILTYPRSIKTPSVTVVYSSVYDIKTDKFRQYFTVFRRLIGHSITDREGIRTLLVKQSYTIVFDP